MLYDFMVLFIIIIINKIDGIELIVKYKIGISNFEYSVNFIENTTVLISIKIHIIIEDLEFRDIDAVRTKIVEFDFFISN